MTQTYSYKWWALIGISLLAFTAFLDYTIVNTALPFIKTALNASIIELQWVINIFAVVLSMTMIAVGKFADLWGRKKVFYLGSVIFGVAALAAGFSPNVEFLIASRAIQAIGCSVLFVSAVALLSQAFPKQEQSCIIGIYSGITGSGLMLGPFFGGLLISIADWRWVFWINVPLIVIGLLCCSFSLRHVEHTHPQTKLDWKGLLLLIAGLGSLVYGIINISWLPILIGVSLLTILAYCELKSKEPLLDFTVFQHRLTLLAALSCMAAGVAIYVFLFFDPLSLQIIRNLSAFHIGLLIAAIPVGQVLISFIYHILHKHWNVSTLLLFSITSALLSIICHRFVQEATPILFLFMGINWGLTNTGTMTAANEAIAPHKIGEAVGTIYTTWNIVGSLFLSITSVVFHYSGSTSFMAGYHAVGDVCIFSALAIWAFSSWVKLRPSR